MESDTSPTGRKRGCLRAAGIATLIMVSLPLGMCAWLDWDAPRGQLPSSVAYLSIAHSSYSTGLREGCFEAIYKLAPETTARLKREGLTMLDGASIPKENARNPYRPWRRTPLPFVKTDKSVTLKAQPDPGGAPFTLFARNAEAGCETTTRLPVSVGNMLAAPGGFYTITANGEGLIVIDTERGYAAVLYAG